MSEGPRDVSYVFNQIGLFCIGTLREDVEAELRPLVFLLHSSNEFKYLTLQLET